MNSSVKAKLLSFGLVLLLITACEKDKDDSSLLLIGKWNQLSTSRVDYSDNVMQGDTTITYLSGKLILDIYGDGTAVRFNNGIISDSFYWTTDGNIFITNGDNGLEVKYEFQVNDTELVLRWALESIQDGHTQRSDYHAIYNRVK